jgi:hypothetical protein
VAEGEQADVFEIARHRGDEPARRERD